MTEKKVCGELWNQSLNKPHDVEVDIMSEKIDKKFKNEFGPFKKNISEVSFKNAVLNRIKRRLAGLQVTVATPVPSVGSDYFRACRLILR